MEFRTTFKIEPSLWRITYNEPVMFIGSCFAKEIGGLLEAGRMPVMINPAGTMYNPVSVCNCLEMIASDQKLNAENLYDHNGLYLSFLHNTEFSSTDSGKALHLINQKTENAHEFLSSANFLFITFGTARVYRLKKTGLIVSNCHKLPSEHFIRELLTVEHIVSLWWSMLDRLHELLPSIRVCFTVSPVRHWKDGAHANQVSKSVLILAIEKLMDHPSLPAYFPAYEVLLDDLRDYRFYDDDMLHPSKKAVEYIREVFSETYFDHETILNRKEVAAIVQASQHRLLTGSPEGSTRFASVMLNRIEAVSKKNPKADLSGEKQYFLRMLKNATGKST